MHNIRFEAAILNRILCKIIDFVHRCLRTFILNSHNSSATVALASTRIILFFLQSHLNGIEGKIEHLYYMCTLWVWVSVWVSTSRNKNQFQSSKVESIFTPIAHATPLSNLKWKIRKVEMLRHTTINLLVVARATFNSFHCFLAFFLHYSLKVYHPKIRESICYGFFWFCSLFSY